MERRRTSLEIAADILRVAKSGARKTHIVYGANLNFNIVKGYLKKLIEGGKLTQDGSHYHTTAKGQEYIRLVEALVGA